MDYKKSKIPKKGRAPVLSEVEGERGLIKKRKENCEPSAARRLCPAVALAEADLPAGRQG